MSLECRRTKVGEALGLLEFLLLIPVYKICSVAMNILFKVLLRLRKRAELSLQAYVRAFIRAGYRGFSINIF